MKTFIALLIVGFCSSVYAGCPGGVCSIGDAPVRTPVRTVVAETVNVVTHPVATVGAVVNRTTHAVSNCCSRVKARRCRCR